MTIQVHVTSLSLLSKNAFFVALPPWIFLSLSLSPHRRPKLKNIDRSTAQQLAITVGNVTVIITDFKEKTRTSSTSSSTVTSSAGSEQQHQSSGSESMDKGSSRASTPKGDLSVGHDESFWAPRTLSRPQGCTLPPFSPHLALSQLMFISITERGISGPLTHTHSYTYTYICVNGANWTMVLGHWATWTSFPFLETSHSCMYCFIFVHGCAAESTFFCFVKKNYICKCPLCTITTDIWTILDLYCSYLLCCIFLL